MKLLARILSRGLQKTSRLKVTGSAGSAALTGGLFVWYFLLP